MGQDTERNPTMWESLPEFGQEAIQGMIGRGLEFTEPGQAGLFTPEEFNPLQLQALSEIATQPTSLGLGEDFGLDVARQVALGAVSQRGGDAYKPSFDFGQRSSAAFSGVDPYLSSAGGYAREAANVAAQGVTGDDISRYMNPYTQQVIDPALRDIASQEARQLSDISALASNAGAFGGTRQALLEGQARESALEATGDISGRLRGQAFDTALGASQQDMARRLQAGQLGASTALSSAGQQQNLATALMNARTGVQGIRSQQLQDQLAQGQLGLQGSQQLGNLQALAGQLSGQQIGLGQQSAQQALGVGDLFQQQSLAERQVPLSQLEFESKLLGQLTGLAGGGNFAGSTTSSPLSTVGSVAAGLGGLATGIGAL